MTEIQCKTEQQEKNLKIVNGVIELFSKNNLTIKESKEIIRLVCFQLETQVVTTSPSKEF